MRRILLLLILALLLAGLALANREAANWHYVVPADDGVLYAAGYDDFLDEWEQYEDGQLTALAQDGAFRLSIAAQERIPFSVAAHRFTDFDLRVTAQALQGPLNNAYGVVFRLVNPQNNYQFLVSSDGYYGVRRVLDGEETFLSTWIDSPVVNQGMNATNTLRVVAQGDQFQFYVNEQLVPLCIPNEPGALSTYSMGQCFGGTMHETLTDSSIASGQLGVVAQSFEDVGVVVQTDDEGNAVSVNDTSMIAEFDNFVVLSPDAIVAEQTPAS